jgi:hypothetical protein
VLYLLKALSKAEFLTPKATMNSRKNKSSNYVRAALGFSYYYYDDVISFETDDGVYRNEQGTIKNLGSDQAANEVTGEVSWTSPEGEFITFTYKADENGYQAQGSHLPQAPPLHPHIQRGLDLIARVNQRNNQ